MKIGYLIDMDGVIYRENQLINGAMEFVAALLNTGTPFLFLTNNSAPTPGDLAVRLNYMFHRARQKLAEHSRGTPAEVVMIGDTMETDIRGALEAGMHGFLVLSGSTQLEVVGDYVYQPTRILESVADLTDEIKTGQASDRLNSPVFAHSGFHGGKSGSRHQTDILALYKSRPRPAMTK